MTQLISRHPENPVQDAASLLHAAVPAESPYPAVQCGDRELSYTELHRRAAGVAAALRARGAHQDMPVGIRVSDPLLFVPAMLGVLQAGCAYVPLDPGWPAARYTGLARRIGMRILLGAPDSLAPAVVDGLSVLHLENLGQAEPQPVNSQPPGSLAYLILTSGSTGEPKGVGVSHEAAVRSMRARHRLYGGKVHRFLWHSPPAFDSSVAGLFWTLADGGTLVVPERDARIDPRELVRLIRDRKITHLLCLPRVWREVVSCAAPADLATLTTPIVAGEAVPPQLPREHATASDSVLWNEYGPAEGGVWATHWRCDSAAHSDSVPIGAARPGIDVVIARDDLSACEAGEVGEIWLFGPGLARGYPGVPGQTAERFVPCPFGVVGARAYRTGDLGLRRPDGVLEFRGRRDEQVKIAGVRVEPAEVERGLLTIEGVKEVSVLAREDEPGRASLTGCLVLSGTTTIEHVTRAAGDVLPALMVPARLVAVDALPQNTNGKVDRHALAGLASPAVDEASAEESAPADEDVADLLGTVMEAWRTVLRNPDIPAEADLFMAGGDSISAVMICSKLAESGLTLTPFELFHARSPLRVAKLLADRGQQTQPVNDSTAAEPAEPAATSQTVPVDAGQAGDNATRLPLTPVQRWFVDTQPETALSHWNFSVGLSMSGVDPDVVRAAFTGVLDRHPMLSAVYEKAAGSEHWRVRPGRGPVPLVIEFVESLDKEALAPRIAAWQASLDLVNGPVARLLWFESAGAAPQARAVLVAHHLVMDAVSLRVLVGELDIALRDGQVLGEGPDPSEWIRVHTSEIQDGAYDQELQFWLDRAREAAFHLTGDVDPGKEGETCHLVRRLSGEAVDGFLAASRERRTGATEMILAAAAAAVPDVFPELLTLGVDVEAHGRPGHGPMGSGGAVHWFTSFYPVPVRLNEATSPAGALAEARGALAGVPGEGLGFLALAHGGSASAADSEFDRIPPPLLGLNYLGRLDSSFSVGTARFDVEVALPAQRSDSARRRHVLDLDCFVEQDGLVFRWTYAGGRFPAADVERLADLTIDRLHACLEVDRAR